MGGVFSARTAEGCRKGVITVSKSKGLDVVRIERITQVISVLRGNRVLLDGDLAELYGVETARLNQQVRRNLGRFPSDFMFQLTPAENEALMLQNAISKPGRGGRRKLPLAFTEHGAIMVATVLNSGRAVEVSVYVVRAFVGILNQIRQLTNTLKRGPNGV